MNRLERYSLNLNKISPKATSALMELDNSFIGTKDYMGITYFWNYEYRHDMRSNRRIWIPVHSEMLKLGLNVGEQSGIHRAIIDKYIRKLGKLAR